MERFRGGLSFVLIGVVFFWGRFLLCGEEERGELVLDGLDLLVGRVFGLGDDDRELGFGDLVLKLEDIFSLDFSVCKVLWLGDNDLLWEFDFNFVVLDFNMRDLLVDKFFVFFGFFWLVVVRFIRLLGLSVLLCLEDSFNFFDVEIGLEDVEIVFRLFVWFIL